MHKRAQVTIASIPVEKEMAREFGVIETAQDGGIMGFHEKRADAPTMPRDPERVYASMGNYIFSTNLRAGVRPRTRRIRTVRTTSRARHSPGLVGSHGNVAYDFTTNRIAGDPANQEPYWRDVGTIDAYYEANMDLRAVTPALNLVQSQMASQNRGIFRCANEVYFRPGRAARTGAGFDCRGLHHSFRRPGARQRARPRRARPFRGAGRRLHYFRQLRHRTPGQRAEATQECPRAGRCADRLRPGEGTENCITSPIAGSW